MLEIQIKTFDELQTKELYDLLQLRSEVFVVEQDCVYQDIDGKDQKALHVLGYYQDQLVAYTRLFKPGDYFEYSSIGRVVVKESFRQFGFGKDIMKASIKVIEEGSNGKMIKISAQCYLKKFYNELGFIEEGDTYLEDGIPHMAMYRKLEA